MYRFFKNYPALMWTLLVATSLLFAFFAPKLNYEENVTKLLPKTDRAQKGGLAFDQLSIKDKLFVQIVARDDASVAAADLVQASEDFVDLLTRTDSATQYVAHILYRIEDDWVVNGMEYALTVFPTVIGSEAYTAFDTLLTPQAIDRAMARNAELIAQDVDGNLSSMLCYDPAGLREAMLPQVQNAMSGASGMHFVDGHLMSPDSSTAILLVAPKFDAMSSGECGKLVRMTNRVIRQFEEDHPDMEVLTHGSIAMSAGNSNRIKGDLVITMGVSLLLILVVLVLCLGFRSTLPALLLPVLYGTAFAMSGMYWLKGSMSLLSLGLGTLVLGIALSYVLHVLVHHKYTNNPERMLKEQASPICLSCLTTIGAMLGLTFTHSDLLADFGIFAALALTGTTACTLVFLPHFLNERNSSCNDKAFRLLERMNSFPVDRKPAFLIAIAVVCVVCFFTSGRVKFDSDLRNIGYASKAYNRSMQHYNDKVSGGYSNVFYATSANDMDEAIRNTQVLDSLLDSLQATGLVKGHTAWNRLYRTTEQQEANIEAWKNYWSPQRVARVEQAITSAARKNGIEADFFEPFFTMIESDYEPSMLLESEALPIELSSNMYEQNDSTYIIFTSAQMEEGNYDTVSNLASELPGVFVCNAFFYTDEMVNLVHDNFNTVMLIALIFVLVVLILSFRNLVVALLAFMPMMIGWYVVQGIMALFGIEFNLINVILSSFIFGVGVDYSIFTTRGLLASARGEDPDLLSQHRVAILLSAFMLLVVASSLLIAQHPAIHSMGLCTLIGMTASILFCYSIQPFLFRMLMKWNYFANKITRKND